MLQELVYFIGLALSLRGCRRRLLPGLVCAALDCRVKPVGHCIRRFTPLVRKVEQLRLRDIGLGFTNSLEFPLYIAAGSSCTWSSLIEFIRIAAVLLYFLVCAAFAVPTAATYSAVAPLEASPGIMALALTIPQHSATSRAALIFTN